MDCIDLDPLRLNAATRKLSIDGNTIRLRNKEYTLLEYFMSNVGTVLSRTRILEDVWDNNIFCNTNTVDVHVSRLRKKLKDLCGNSFIKTIHCVGYVFEI